MYCLCSAICDPRVPRDLYSPVYCKCSSLGCKRWYSWYSYKACVYAVLTVAFIQRPLQQATPYDTPASPIPHSSTPPHQCLRVTTLSFAPRFCTTLRDCRPLGLAPPPRPKCATLDLERPSAHSDSDGNSTVWAGDYTWCLSHGLSTCTEGWRLTDRKQLKLPTSNFGYSVTIPTSAIWQDSWLCVVNTVKYVYVQLGELLDPGASLIFVRIHFINTVGETLYSYIHAGKLKLEGGRSRYSGSPAMEERTTVALVGCPWMIVGQCVW